MRKLRHGKENALKSVQNDGKIQFLGLFVEFLISERRKSKFGVILGV